MKEIITNSSLSTFRTCPRKYQIQYELGYKPAKEAEALFIGKLMHKGIEAWSASRDLEQAVNAIYKMVDESKNQDEYMVAKVHALMEGYHRKYQDQPYKVILVEAEGRGPLINPETNRESQSFEIGFVIDRIFQDKNSRYVLVETKTTSSDIEDPASDYWMNLLMDSQVSTYYLGAEVLGYPVDRCIYDVIKKPGIRPKQVGKEIDQANPKRIETSEEYFARLQKDIAEAPDRFYMRREVPRLKNDLEEYMADTWITAGMLREARKLNKFPRFVRSCIGLYGTCSYFPVCSGRASLDDPMLYKKSEKKHSELQEVKK